MDGERVGVSGAGMAAAGEVSRAARWQKLSGTEVRPAGAGVAVAVGMAAGVAVAGAKAAGEAAAAGVSSAGTVAVGVALAGAGQWSSRSVAAAVWPRQQLGSSSNMVYCMENEPAVRRPVSAHVDLHRRFT